MERSADVVRAVARDCPRVSLAANGTNRFYAKGANQAALLAQGEGLVGVRDTLDAQVPEGGEMRRQPKSDAFAPIVVTRPASAQ